MDTFTYRPRPTAVAATIPTLGVEEEFLLLDPDTGVNRPVAEQVHAALPVGLREQSRFELRRSMIEMVTPVCSDLAGLRRQLVRNRRAAAAVVSPALLRHGDLELAVTELARLRRDGTGADRQRQTYLRTADPHAVLSELAEQTAWS
jgi:hypothetical protein